MEEKKVKKRIRMELPESQEELLGTPPSEETSLMDDKLDLLAHTLEIHHKSVIPHSISKDLVLFMCDEKTEEFITGMHRCALQLAYFTPDPKVGARLRDLIVHETMLIAVLRRNRPENPILAGCYATPVQEEDPVTSFVDSIKGLVPGQKKKQVK